MENSPIDIYFWEKAMNRQEFIDSVNTIEELTTTERIIVDYFIQHYTMLPFAKIEDLCREVGVGKATLGRFLQRLGFSGFIAFKKSVSDDLVQELTTPIERYQQSNESQINLLTQHYQEIEQNLKKTYERLSLQDVEQAIQLMQRPQGKLYVLGSASAEALANYFYLLARYLRKEVVLLRADTSTLPHQLVDVTEEDTLFAISYHRFSYTTVRMVRWFAQQHCNVIVLTDQIVNPFVAYATVLFNVDSQSEAIFNNRTAGFSVIELIIKGLSTTSGQDERFQRIEGLFSEFNIFKQ